MLYDSIHRVRVFFSDEELFLVVTMPCTGVLDRETVFYFCEELEHHSPHVIVWGAMNSEHPSTQYFFDGAVIYFN